MLIESNEIKSEANLSIFAGELRKLKTFVGLLKEVNPDLSMGFCTSFKDVPEEYREGRFVGGASRLTQSSCILVVDGDFDLPTSPYYGLCTSWRNNGHCNGGAFTEDGAFLEELEDEKLVPNDFDVIFLEGNGVDHRDASRMAIYVIGGCANKKKSKAL